MPRDRIRAVFRFLTGASDHDEQQTRRFNFAARCLIRLARRHRGCLYLLRRLGGWRSTDRFRRDPELVMLAAGRDACRH